MAVRIRVLLAVLPRALCVSTTCGVLTGSRAPGFCTGVTWNASLPLDAAELDAAAQSDYKVALSRLTNVGRQSTLPMCLVAWKALQCASKFQKCSRELPAQKVNPLSARGMQSPRPKPASAHSAQKPTLLRTVLLLAQGVPFAVHQVCGRVQRFHIRHVSTAAWTLSLAPLFNARLSPLTSQGALRG